jgi:hypothetical protein
LREKKMNDRSGKGIEGLRRAEAVLRAAVLEKKGKGRMYEELDMEEDSEDEAWADQRAAAEVAQNGAGRLQLRMSEDDSDDDEGGNNLDLAEATKHLEAGQGEAVGKILDSDRKGRVLNGRNKQRLMKGLPLWRESEDEDEMTMDDRIEPEAIARMPFSAEELKTDKALACLQSAVASHGEFCIQVQTWSRADWPSFRHTATTLSSEPSIAVDSWSRPSAQVYSMAFLVGYVFIPEYMRLI